MGDAVKVTVIATGFNKAPRKVAPTPVDLSNYVGPQPAPRPLPRPRPAASTARRPMPRRRLGGQRPLLDLDVPAFLRKRRRGGGD